MGKLGWGGTLPSVFCRGVPEGKAEGGSTKTHAENAETRLKTHAPRSGRTGALRTAVQKTRKASQPKEVRQMKRRRETTEETKVKRSTSLCRPVPSASAPHSGATTKVTAGVMAPSCPICLSVVFGLGGWGCWWLCVMDGWM